MTDQTQAIRETAAKPTKKTYALPRILSRERLEAVASACSGGTSKIDNSHCPFGPTQS